jgi:hypothetical protein
LGEEAAEIADLVDAIEVCNGQNLFPNADRRARRLAWRLGLPMYAGADSHKVSSIAPCHQQLLRDFTDSADFLDALRHAELRTGYHPASYFVHAACRTARHLLGYPLPVGFGANAGAHPRSARSPRRGGAGDRHAGLRSSAGDRPGPAFP